MAVLGPDVDLSYDFEHLGDSPDALEKLANGSHPFAKKLASAKKPAIIVGSEVLQRPDGAALMANAQKLAHTVKTKSGCGSEWRVLNVLHKVASQVSIQKEKNISFLLPSLSSTIYILQIFSSLEQSKRPENPDTVNICKYIMRQLD